MPACCSTGISADGWLPSMRFSAIQLRHSRLSSCSCCLTPNVDTAAIARLLFFYVNKRPGSNAARPRLTLLQCYRTFHTSVASTPFASPSSSHENAPRKPWSFTYLTLVPMTVGSS
ncbi:hypothetical protein D3C85_476400 [compost metagenome]